MNKPINKYIQRKIDQAVGIDDLRRWEEVKDRAILKQKIEKSRTREVKLKHLNHHFSTFGILIV